MEKAINDIEQIQNNENANSNKTKFENKTRATVFLIDAREKMLSIFDQEKSAFASCLECVRNTLRHKIFNEQKWYCSIVLLGTKMKNNSLNLNNLTVLQELSLIGVEHILKIDQIINEDAESYKNKYGFDNFSLANAFRLSNKIFSESSKKLKKSVKLFTNDDNAVITEKTEYYRIMVNAKHMYKNYVRFEAVFLGNDFNVNKFYKAVFQYARNNVNSTPTKPVTSLKEMEKETTKTYYKHSFPEKLPFVIDEKFQIGVTIHFPIRKKKLPFKVNLTKSTNEKVFSKMQMVATETGSIVDKSSVIMSKVVGKKEINFNMEELNTFSKIGKIELRLMGFKPTSVISIENFVKPCAFIYPDESKLKGSFVFFAALLRRCIVKQVVPICTLCLRSNSTSRFVALIPQNGNSTTGSQEDLPQGFIVFFLPFAEEIRTFDNITTNRADSDQVEIAVNLIQKLKINYEIERFQNPKLKTHWAAIEALALGLEKKSVSDSTYPNYELIFERSGKIAKEFIEAVYPCDYDPEICGAPKKRMGLGVQPTEINMAYVETLIRQGKGEKLTNDVLKAFLKSVGLGRGLLKTRKADLIEKAKKHLKLN